MTVVLEAAPSSTLSARSRDPAPRRAVGAGPPAGFPDLQQPMSLTQATNLWRYALFDRSRFGLELGEGSAVADHYMPTAMIREVRDLHQQMSQQNRLISSVALVTVLRYIMCDLAQVLQMADNAARLDQGDSSGAAPEPDEELLMQTYLVTQGRDTDEKRWARAMVRLQKELMGMCKAVRMTAIRRLQMGQQASGIATQWSAQLEALLVALASEGTEVEGATVMVAGWLEQWHAELSYFIPGLQLINGVLEVESQDPRGDASGPTDRDIEQLAADQEEEREWQRKREEEAEREQLRREEHEAMCEAELLHLQQEAVEYRTWEDDQMRNALLRERGQAKRRRCVIGVEIATGSSDAPCRLHTLSFDVPEQGELQIAFKASMQPDPEDVSTEPCLVAATEGAQAAELQASTSLGVHAGTMPNVLPMLEFEEYQSIYNQWASGVL